MTRLPDQLWKYSCATFHPLEAGVGGGFLFGEHTGGVENVQALVFHGAHVEIIHGDDHEDVEIVFPPVGVFVPAHGVFEREHGVVAFVDVFAFDKNPQGDFAAGLGHKLIFNVFQVAGDQGEEVGGFFEGVVPGGKVAAFFGVALLDEVAVGEQCREALFVGDDGGGKFTHHVGAIEVPGDFTEAFGFALGAVEVAGFVQAVQCCVVLGVDFANGFQLELFGRVAQGKPFVVEAVLVFVQRLAVDGDGDEFDVLAVEGEFAFASADVGVAAQF